MNISLYKLRYYCDPNRVRSSLAQVDFEKSVGLEKEWGNVVASG
jgi:hypothetical protein